MEPGSGGSPRSAAERLEAAWRKSLTLRQLSAEAVARARATQHQVRRARLGRQMSQEWAFARLQARLESMPVIEQAKGIIMAQRQCGPEEAFEVLRRASQRANIKVHVLAAQIVEHVTSGKGSTVTPISLGTARHRRF